MTVRPKLVAGNWKMNGVMTSLVEVEAIREGAKALAKHVQLAICPPATLAGAVAPIIAGTGIGLGGQDCHWQASGAHTGDISANMWADLGARYVIVGHSERRTDHHETNQVVAKKAASAILTGLEPIICIGESLEQRDAGQTLEVVNRQLSQSVPAQAADAAFVVAYEPIWAIGTGRTPTPEQVREVHAALRESLRERFGVKAETVQILYGGSVKPSNAAELMHLEDVDGALVGGACLKAVDFLAIAAASA